MQPALKKHWTESQVAREFDSAFANFDADFERENVSGGVSCTSDPQPERDLEGDWDGGDPCQAERSQPGRDRRGTQEGGMSGAR